MWIREAKLRQSEGVNLGLVIKSVKINGWQWMRQYIEKANGKEKGEWQRKRQRIETGQLHGGKKVGHMERIKRVGIIGCGGIAQVHGWALSQRNDITMVVACDKERVRAEHFCEKYIGKGSQGQRGWDEQEQRTCCVETDWRKLCEMDLDAVHVCTPHYLHAPMAVELLKSGKAVFMEKPCAISREQFAQLCEADRMHPGKLGFCFQNRYNETTRMTDELIAEGRIGRVIGTRGFVTWQRDEEYYQSSDWKGGKVTEGGGVLINQSIHTLDLMLRYLGKPVAVQASTHNHHLQGVIEVEDAVEAWMRFPEGQRACFYASNGYAEDAPVILEIQGEKGRIMICGAEVTLYSKETGIQHFELDSGVGIGKSYWGVGHKACINDFYDSLDAGKAFPIDVAGVETTFDTMMRIYECSANSDGERERI